MPICPICVPFLAALRSSITMIPARNPTSRLDGTVLFISGDDDRRLAHGDAERHDHAVAMFIAKREMVRNLLAALAHTNIVPFVVLMSRCRAEREFAIDPATDPAINAATAHLLRMLYVDRRRTTVASECREGAAA